MTSAEITEWIAFIEIEGLPESNDEIRAAKQLHAFVNANRDPKKHKSEIPIDRFLPDWMKEQGFTFRMDEEPERAQVDPTVQQAASDRMKALQSQFR